MDLQKYDKANFKDVSVCEAYLCEHSAESCNKVALREFRSALERGLEPSCALAETLQYIIDMLENS